MEVLNVLFALSALFATAVADCGVDGMRCCLTEFLTLTGPLGIKLGERSLAAACTIRSDTLLCLEDFSDHCVASTNEELTASINKTTQFINSACSPASDFVKSLKEYEGCFQNVSQSLQSCYNRTLLPVASDDDESKWRAECCEYKELRNCAVQTVEDLCGASASQLLQSEVMNINGAGLEVACVDVFPKCVNSAVTLASSILLVLLVSFFSVNGSFRFL